MLCCSIMLDHLHLIRYRWLFYINPNYYGFSSSANLLLSNFTRECKATEFECYAGSSEYILREFDFDDINPYMHIAVSHSR